MQFLIADSYYPGFLETFHRRHPRSDYDRALEGLIASRFGHSDYYSRNLRALGHGAADVVLNDRVLQAAWARECAAHLSHGGRPGRHRWLLAVFEEQVRQARPDVVLIHDMTFLPPELVHHLRGLAGRVIGQIASPIDFSKDWTGYDLVLSSFPHFVDRFRRLGVAAEYLPLAFEPSLLDELPVAQRDLDAVFVGSISGVHSTGTSILEQVASSGHLQVWGTGADSLPVGSALQLQHRGPAWGLDMFRILSRARVSLNRHIDVAAGYANNMRLFESTGVGACLLTDAARNLVDMFEPDHEVVAYSSAAECIEKIRYLLDHESERAAIAEAGRQRTLRDHTYARRMAQLVGILDDHPAAPRRTSRTHWKPVRPDPLDALRSVVAASPAAPAVRALLRAVRRRSSPAISAHHTVIQVHDITDALTDGWRDEAIPTRQRELVRHELAEMRSGRPTPAFRTAAAAVAATGLRSGTLLEVGCASGYYSEVLRYMTDVDLVYAGVDYSPALLREARRHYRDLGVAAGDGAALPFRSDSVDIVLSAAVVMHMPAWRDAIAEMARVTRDFCILHRTPVVADLDTIWLRKVAYGVDVVELVFNEAELRRQLADVGVVVTDEWSVDEYDLPGILEPVRVMTYLGKVTAA